MPIGSLAAIWTYPVKGHAATAHATCAVDIDGLAGDRASALVVDDPAHPRRGKTWSGMQHGRLHTMARADEGRDLAAAARTSVALANGRRFFELAPVSIVFDRWLREAEALTGIALDPLRYRPNVLVTTASDASASERALVGATLEIGDVALTVVAPIYRCSITTYDPQTGAASPAVLRELVARRDNILGVYATVTRAGTLVRGTPVTAR